MQLSLRRWPFLIFLSILATTGMSAGASCGELLDLKINHPWMDSVYQETPNVKSLIATGVNNMRVARANGKSEVEQIKEAVKVVRSQISYTKCAAAYPEPTFSLVLQRKQGGCQHFAVLTAAILVNANFLVQFVVHKEVNQIGHVWLEVLSSNSGTNQKYIVDPSEPSYVLPVSEAYRRLQKSPRSDEGLWYLNPQRRYFDL